MKLDQIANSGNDNFFTPLYAIKPITKYIKPHSTIWCPFDTEDSLYVKTFSSLGHQVIYTHIDLGVNFFDCNVVDCDYIISNPPYSCRTEILERLFDIGIPFAMLIGVVGLFESQRRFDLFRSNNFEIMYMNKRISYFKDYAEQKPSANPPFSSVYVCHHILPKQIVFETINK